MVDQLTVFFLTEESFDNSYNLNTFLCIIFRLIENVCYNFWNQAFCWFSRSLKFSRIKVRLDV